MIVFPNCKINIGLNILGKREDGYHNLETVFYPLPFYDVLEIIQNKNANSDYELTVTGIPVAGNIDENLCIKAYRLLKQDFPQLPAVKIYLHKNIPLGAGLGGGSANGAFMLKLLNDKFTLQLTQQQLMQYALQLGSDCPFFVMNKPCFAEQRGEILQPINLNLSDYKLMLINPGIHISTKWAFTHIEFLQTKSLKNLIEQPIEAWKQVITNDFELPVFNKYIQIKNLKEFLYKQKAVYASMTGSGSTVYGIFSRDSIIDYSSLPVDYFIKEMFL